MKKLTKKIEVTGELKLSVKVLLSKLTIRKTEESIVMIRYEFNPKNENTQLEELFSINYQEQENLLEIRELDRKKEIMSSSGDLVLEVPDLADLKVDSENGLVSINDLKSEIWVESENGSINMSTCQGNATLRTENGSLSVRSHEGKLRLETENGEVGLSSGKSELLNIVTENGRIRVMDHRFQNAEIIAENGSIYCEMPVIEKGSCTIKNQNGKITLLVPDDLSFSLVASNDNGRFHIGLPDHYETDRIDNKRTIRLVRGGGKVNIKLENENGSIDALNSRHKKSNWHENCCGHDFKVEEMMNGIFDNIGNHIDPNLEAKIREKMQKKMEKVTSKLGQMPDRINEKLQDFMSKISSESNKTAQEQGVEEEEKASRNMQYELKILNMVEKGTISSEEAEKLLKALNREE